MRLGPYLLTECIATGGMAAVYHARRRGVSGFETSAVVKTLLPEHRRNQRYVRMFKEEAKLSAQLQHANVVRVHDFGHVAGIPFLEMEDLTGWNLQQLGEAAEARGERVPVPIALAILSEACRGLAYAHSFVDDKGAHRPIIHRDVSPSNIVICKDGAVKLVDFGLAQLTRGETLEIDTFLGKLAYMSPEQLERRQLDRRADVFALGVTMYELISGKRLFAGANNVETLKRLQTLVVEPPSRLNPSAPAALDVVVLRALHRDPDQRYQSAAELLAAIDAIACPVASRAQLLSYLGALAPEMFTHACDGCGERVAWGADCASCKTRMDPSPFDEEAPPAALVPVPDLRSTALASTVLAPLRRAPAATIQWLKHRKLVLKLTLVLLWRRLDAWRADRRARRAGAVLP
ncbi:MAG TPA: serine/threonine-protein kinase [Polyangia bacterium]